MFKVQAILGNSFVDLVVEAANEQAAIKAAKAQVKADPGLKLFRHNFTRFVI